MSNKYPPAFIRTIELLLGENASQFWDALREPAFSGIRINPQKSGLEELRSAIPGTYTPLPWSPHGYILSADQRPGLHPYHAAGLFYLQEPSAMAPVALLDPQPGDRVLDLCAAPGGKTTQILARMGDQGLLIANDSHPGRVQALARNLERWGATIGAVVCEKPSRLSEHFGPYFDRVLVDAPCSGEGTFRSDPGEVKKWSPGFVDRCCSIQDEILWYAGKLVRPGGSLVYSTCTFNQKENEGTIARFLSGNPDFQLASGPAMEGFSPGIPTPGGAGLDFSKAVRIWPQSRLGEGHFIALLKKDAQGEGSARRNRGGSARLAPSQVQTYSHFLDNCLKDPEATHTLSPSNPALQVFGNRLYHLPENSPSLAGLNVIHWGWWLGTFLGEGFQPSPALAAALDPGEVQKVLEFSLGDPNLAAYRRGSPLAYPGDPDIDDSWILVCAGGHPLGWGKNHAGRMKSYFPRWLRTG